MKRPMTLGELIAAVKRKDPEHNVVFDFVHFAPDGTIHSYRGDYSQLAIGYSREKDELKVPQFVAVLEKGRGTFEGYKGGNYTMDDSTVVFVALHDETGRTAIVDVRDNGYQVVLVTAKLDG